MEINGIKVKGKEFAYDGCHKIYIIENKENKNTALQFGYKILPIDKLEEVYDNSCGLRFIHNWELTKDYVRQGETATFSY